MRSVIVGLLLLAACKAKEPSVKREGGCLALPPAARHTLRADPRGQGLYWIETVIGRSYDGEDMTRERLVRYDLARDVLEVVREYVASPIQFTKRGVLVRNAGATAPLLDIEDGHVQAVTPPYFDVRDVEPITDTQVAVLANADGKSSVFVLDLARPRPVHLIDADVLLSAVPGTVYVRDGTAAYAVEVATGAREPRDVPGAAMPDRDLIYFVESDRVHVRSLRTGERRVLVDEARAWKLLHQPGSVLARAGTAPAYAFELAGGEAMRLPVLKGGTSVVGTTRLADGTRWALIGHNTSNLDGDLATATHEADVCTLDAAASELTFESRTLPARYAARGDAFWAAGEKLVPDAKWQVFDSVGGPASVYIEVKDDGGDDLARLRDRVREVHRGVTRLLDDEEQRTHLEFRDGRVAIFRWRRDRLRGRASAGIGDVVISDPADFDVALADVVDEQEGDQLRCSLKLTNLRTVTLLDLQVRCVGGDGERVIAVPRIEPKQTLELAKTFAVPERGEPFVEVFRGREPLVALDVAEEERARRRYDLFAGLQRDTQLALRSHDVTDGRFYVELQTRAGVAEVDADRVRSAAARIEAARTELGTVGDAELELQVLVDRKRHDWNGSALVPVP